LSEFVFVGIASEIAREAGALLKDFYERGVTTEYKGDVDLVTEADRASEALIRRRLAEEFPEHGIYGEEGTRERMGGEYRWYVELRAWVSGVLRRPGAGTAGARAASESGWRDGGGSNLRSVAG
jgi:3'-phosphoadenosine 5'-phosphosulfate (PAPS) 3'-phosphatase